MLIALDIGGANLKGVSETGFCLSQSFRLWKHPDQLQHQLSSIVQQLLDSSLEACRSDQIKIRVTMTGELADCFENKQQGVARIVQQTSAAFPDSQVTFYLVDGRLVSATQAISEWNLAAASNWHATASFVADHFQITNGLLLDIGSTTTDAIPLRNQLVGTGSSCDLDRIRNHELFYLGCRRSPVCSIASSVELNGAKLPIAAELFSTLADALVVAGKIPTDSNDFNTADGRPLTIENSRQRLARCFCADADEFSIEELESIAQQITAAHSQKLLDFLKPQFEIFQDADATVIVCGEGSQMALDLIGKISPTTRVISFDQEFGDSASQCAAAYSLSKLASKLDTVSPSSF